MKLMSSARALASLSGRTSLQWTWTMRSILRASSASGSPPEKELWPVSKSSPTASPVTDISRSVSASVSTIVPM